jgi:dsDNA-binding SOS-regulon protein
MLKDKVLFELIERLREQYHVFLSNKYVKKYLYEADIPRNVWVDIEDVFGSIQHYEAAGYDIKGLYDKILALVEFLTTLTRRVVPRMQNEDRMRVSTLAENDQVVYQMTINNAPGNVKAFSQHLSGFYERLKALDTQINGPDAMILNRDEAYRSIERLLTV